MIEFTKWWVCTGVTRKVQMIGNARVPLLMFVDAQANIACDVSVDNGSALFKSRVLRWITDMDPRCRCLIFLIKCWAKAQSINDPKMGTLNSFTICLLVVFHLQVLTPQFALVSKAAYVVISITVCDICSTLYGRACPFG
jgi:DNA polymerase sigma